VPETGGQLGDERSFIILRLNRHSVSRQRVMGLVLSLIGIYGPTDMVDKQP
jgi:hypothetical protein